MREPAVVSTPAGRDHVLERDRDARPVGLLRRCAGTRGARRSRSSIASRYARVQLGRGDLATLDQPERVLGRQPERVDHRAHVVGGTRNRSPSRAGALRNTSSSGSESCGSSSAHALTRSRGCDVGGTSVEVELRHLGDGVEDRAELAGQPLDLVVTQVEAREPRDVEHLFPRDRHPDHPSRSVRAR